VALRPGSILALQDNSDYGMALFAMELMFFEPHGQYLSGNTSDQGSKRKFVTVFDRFKSEVKPEIGLDVPSDRFYSWARCGLFHSHTLVQDILIDARNIFQPFSRNPQFPGGVLVNPYKLLNLLERYLDNYVLTIKEGRDQLLCENFDKAFNHLILQPMEYFTSSE